MVNKEFDIIVYGATGFTGQLICGYLNNHKDINQVKWGIAGRNKQKLEKVANKYSISNLFIADSFNMESLDVITSKAKLIISIVGPYSIYGKKLIESCVNNQCHHLDLTGEPEFVHFVENNYSQKAKDNNVILMNCCGFESIPPDIGTYYTMQKLKNKDANVTTFLKTRGKISGGTWASFLNSFTSKKPIIKSSKNNKKTKKIFYVKELKKWALIFPVIDKHIVKKSGKHIGYGENFSFNQYILFKSLFKILGLVASIMFIGFLAKFKFFRNWLVSFIPSGNGPTKEERSNHWFQLKIFANTKNQQITTTVSGGDPGYGETSKFISEMALCIILDYEQLDSNKGVITPAQCSGNLMVKRLTESGIKFEHKITNLD